MLCIASATYLCSLKTGITTLISGVFIMVDALLILSLDVEECHIAAGRRRIIRFTEAGILVRIALIIRLAIEGRSWIR